MLRDDTAPEPSADCAPNAAWPSFVSRSRLSPRRHASELRRLFLAPEIDPLTCPENLARPPTADRCPALAHWRTDQSA